MRRIAGQFLLFVFIVTLSACKSSNENSLMQNRITTLESQVDELVRQRDYDNLSKNFEEIAYLTPGSSGYTVLRTNIGYITVSLKNIQPYANGSRVTLQFGNVMNAVIDGCKAKIEWGPVDDKGVPANDQAKSMEFSIKEHLDSGAWTNVRVVLENVPPANLGFVRIRNFSHDGIRLTRPS